MICWWQRKGLPRLGVMSEVLGGLCLGIQPGNVPDLCLPVLSGENPQM